MTSTTLSRNGHRETTFEDLKGLRAEGYIRESSLDQRDGFGPDIQRHSIERFAESYGLVLGGRWYAEFLSGRQVRKRREFQQFIDDARVDAYDVLLVDHTSRFGRNQEECIRYKGELQRLGKTIVFVSQGIISGSDRDFLAERINETLDEAYSRNLSRYVAAGLAEKAEHGLHVGPSPLGYKSDLVAGKRERKVIDPETMPALLMALREYAGGQSSFREAADHLNAQGFRTRKGSLFTGYNLRDILANCFYDGKIVHHEGLPDEGVIDGCHEVPTEVRELWRRCQDIKRHRAVTAVGHPRAERRSYPFSRVLRCHRCGSPYHGEATYYRGVATLRLTHERRAQGRNCKTQGRSRTVASLSQEFNERVLTNLHLDGGWKAMIVSALQREGTRDDDGAERARLQRALENLRKQHVWGDLSDEEYRRERTAVERQLKIVTADNRPTELPNLERAAQLLSDLPSLWSHPGVTDEQRETVVQEVFSQIIIDGKALVAVEPKPAYIPLFAAMLLQDSVGYRDLDPPPSPPRTLCSKRPGEPISELTLPASAQIQVGRSSKSVSGRETAADRSAAVCC
ncbi:MAG: recombinase family protein [Chloroflexi bacterium]|nr:recombinase family protein [Chloroflexota bacterium]